MHLKDPLVPAPKAAQLFGITPQTLHTWRKKGHLQAVQLPNGRFAIPTSEVTRIVSEATLSTMNPETVGGGE